MCILPPNCNHMVEIIIEYALYSLKIFEDLLVDVCIIQNKRHSNSFPIEIVIEKVFKKNSETASDSFKKKYVTVSLNSIEIDI